VTIKAVAVIMLSSPMIYINELFIYLLPARSHRRI
jgi:hypothetical protein